MEWQGHSLLLLFLSLVGFCLALCFFVLLRRKETRIRQFEHKLQAAESRSVALTEMAHPSALDRTRKALRKDKIPSSSRNDELLTLRRDLAHARQQIQTLKSEVLAAADTLKEVERHHEGTRYRLARDNEVLVKTVRELEAVVAEQKRQFEEQLRQASAGRGRSQLRQGVSGAQPAQLDLDPDAAATIEDARRRVAVLERALKSEQERGAALRSQKLQLESELRAWTSVATNEAGKVLDPQMFRRWKDRALAGRIQYQMMKQLRDLSDIKLATYQDAVLRLASYVFASTGRSAPLVSRGETPSDRFLGEALAVIAETTFDNHRQGALGRDEDARGQKQSDEYPLGQEPQDPKADSLDLH